MGTGRIAIGRNKHANMVTGCGADNQEKKSNDTTQKEGAQRTRWILNRAVQEPEIYLQQGHEKEWRKKIAERNQWRVV